MVHRDFKPDNVLVGADGRVRVADFGLALLAPGNPSDSTHKVEPNDPNVGDPALLTGGYGTAGTPAYMAPELFAGGKANEHSDQFAFCVALYEALYGVRPFDADTLATLVRKVTAGTLRTPPSERSVSARVMRVVERGLLRKPSDRYPSMSALLAELEAKPWYVRRQMLIAGVSAAAAGGVGGAYLTQKGVAVGTRCQSNRTLSPAWAQRKASIRTQFVNAAPAFGEETWLRVSTQMATYAAQWDDARVAHCETAKRRGGSAQIAACLARARHKFDGLGELFEHADLALVQEAQHAVNSLQPAADCLDPTVLSNITVADPQRARAIEASYRELNAVELMFARGEHATVLDELATLRTHAESIGFAPLVAQLNVSIAQTQMRLGAYKLGETAARAAFDEALAASDDHTAIRAVVLLMQLGTVHGVGVDASVRWMQTGRSILTHMGGHARLEASLLTAYTAVLAGSGDPSRGLRACDEATAALTALSPGHPDLSTVSGNRGTLLLRSGQPELAIAAFKTAAELTRTNSGKQHPSVARWLFALGSLTMTLARFDAAQEYFEEALVLQRKSLGNTHVAVVQTLAHLGVLGHNRGTYATATEAFEQALQAAESLGSQHPMVAEVCARFSNMLSAAGESARALSLAERALSVTQHNTTAEHPSRAIAHGVMMIAYSRANRPRAALLQGKRGLALAFKIHGDEHALTVNLLHEAGQLLLAQGRIEAGVLLLLRAEAALESSVSDPRRLALVLFELARRLSQDDPPRALARARRALEVQPASIQGHERTQIETFIATRQGDPAAPLRQQPANSNLRRAP